MSEKEIGTGQIFALQAVLTSAYLAGIAFVLLIIATSFMLLSFGASFIVIDMFDALSITADPILVSNLFAFIVIALSTITSFRNMKPKLVEYWMMIVNIKSIN